MNERAEIFVRLLDENIDVWRPVTAERLDARRYRIVRQAYDREIERWEFVPGDEVVCDFIDIGKARVLAATRLVDARHGL